MSEQPRPRLTDAEVAALPIAAGRAELLEEIMASTTSSTRTTRTPSGAGGPGGPSRRWLIPATVAAAVGVVATLPLWVGDDGGTATDRDTVATSPTQPTSPGTLPALVADGWQVHDVEATLTEGEIDYRDAQDREVLLQWEPVSADEGPYDRYYAGDGLGPGRPIEFAGGAATVWGSDGDLRIVREAVDGHLVLFRAELPEQQALAVAAQVTLVDLDGLGDLMPADVVTPQEARDAIAAAAADLPLPPGFSVEDIELPGINDRYELGVAVTAPVVCGWADQYFVGRASSGGVGRQEAVDALATSGDWAILAEMAPQGDWGVVIGEIADEMAAGTLTRADVDDAIGCADLSTD